MLKKKAPIVQVGDRFKSLEAHLIDKQSINVTLLFAAPDGEHFFCETNADGKITYDTAKKDYLLEKHWERIESSESLATAIPN